MIPELDTQLLQSFALALFIGALVGVDREHRASSEPHQFGGLRTFILIALAGATSAWIGPLLGLPWLLGVALSGLILLLAASYWISNQQGGSPGLTGEVSAVIVFLLGAACTAGHTEMAVVLAIATSGLLAFKRPLHELAHSIGPDDLAAGLKLLFATFIVLPLLPTEPVDPWGALVPYRLWWLVVLISTLSLLGYAAVRMLGERAGLALTGLFGGLVSSTAVTLTAARQSKARAGGPDALAMAALIAWAVMFARVIIEVAVVNTALLVHVAPMMGTLAVVTALAALAFSLRRTGTSERPEVALRNPFSLWEAVKFGLLFAAVLLAVALGRTFLPEGWLYAIAALAGTTDVDAITLSLAEAAKADLDPGVAARAIVLAACTNTLIKAGMVAALGTRDLARRVGLATAAIALAGAIVTALAPG